MYTIASYRNVPVIGVPAANVVGSTRLLRSQLPLLIRPAYSFTDVCRLIITFMNTFHFNHTAVLTDESNPFYYEFGDILEAQYRADQERLYNNAKFSYFRSEEITALRYRAILHEASLNARVLVLFANASIVRTLMLHAKDLGMTNGEYVYIAVELFRSNYWGEFTWRFDDRHDRDVQLAFRSLAIIALYERHEQFFAEFAKEVRQRSRTQYQYFYGAFEEIDPIVTSFYDSFILYSTAVRKLVEKGGSPENITDGLQIANQIKNMSLDSPLGYPINMDLNGDRSRIYSIKDLDLETGKFSDVLRIDYHEHQEIWFGSFKWPGHVGLPPDEPLCGFGGDARACNISSAIGPAGLAGIILGVLIVMLAIAGTLFSGFNARKAMYGVDPYWWRVRTDELQILSKKGLHAARSGGSLVCPRHVSQSRFLRNA
ncbi:hypothetical protein RvY_01134-1 [Ramazzottius varieornatus]|uniref:Receptor ligand binding region domain-containing protein n=1 Tax=Ramazzottius varieornatus TaxID=947166 RepID=A0A1D1UG50_RAMVA|nr:hypothetical protein RvY_01134-1 [Ramazzottius varieornatus]